MATKTIELMFNVFPPTIFLRDTNGKSRVCPFCESSACLSCEIIMLQITDTNRRK